MENGQLKYGKEIDIAVRVVHLACSLCKRVQDGLIFNKKDNHVLSKDDNSLVTVADYSVKATVSRILSEFFQGENVAIVDEEDAQALSKPHLFGLLCTVVNTVNECLAKAPKFGLRSPKKELNNSQVLEAKRKCNSAGGALGRHWALDPVDGTLGFVRGDQYAVALALIEDGEVVIGVLGCPNYPIKKECLSYHHNTTRPMSAEICDLGKGCVMYARRGSSEAWMQPLILGDQMLEWPNSATQIKVSSIDDPAQATFCESVEKENTSHTFTAGLANTVGLRNQPLRIHDMVKYAAIARGDAEIYMKFARAGYKEKIWDHAAGVVIVQEAGGVVTDAGGRPLNFSKGVYLGGLDRGIVGICLTYERSCFALYTQLRCFCQRFNDMLLR